MRAIVLASVFWAPAVGAAEFQVPLPVVAAEVYPQGARVVAEAIVEVPAGAHELLMLLPREVLGGPGPRVGGAVVTGVEIAENVRFAPKVFDLPSQAAARKAVEAVQDQVDAANAALELAVARIDALAASDAFLRGLTGGDTLPDVAVLSEVAEMIGTELAKNAEARAALTAELPALRQDLSDAKADLARAVAALRGALAPDDSWALVTVSVEAAEAGPLTVRHAYVDVSAGWDVQYEARLGEASLVLSRSVGLRKGMGLPWVEAAVTLSSAQPSGQNAATPISRSIPRIFDPDVMVRTERSLAAPAPMMQADVMEMAAVGGALAKADFEGPFVRYTLPSPVTVLGGGARQLFALSALEFEVDRYLAAAPRFDDYAYVMAEFTNRSGEVLLPGALTIFREDVLVGDGFLPLIAQGQEHELGFGPELTVALDVQFLDQQSGDRGIIRGQSTREDAIRLSAENTGAEAQEVYLRYAVPTSQQEDLEVRVEMAPQPVVRDADDQLGVMEWILALEPGELQEIELSFDMRWPDGQVLDFRP